jgi:hypothetical protein
VVHNTPFRICLNPPFNAIFVESYEDVSKEDNYLMKILFPYLEFFHYLGLNVPTFVDFYPYGAIRFLSRKTMLNFGCYSKNTPWPIAPLSVEIVRHL